MSFIATLLIAAYARAEIKEVDLQVEGLVCAFCAKGLKATLGKDPAVESLQISLEKSEVRLFLKKELSDANITRLVDDAGFKVEKIKRLTN